LNKILGNLTKGAEKERHKEAFRFGGRLAYTKAKVKLAV